MKIWSRAAAQALLEELRLEPVSLSGDGDPLHDYGHALFRPLAAQRPDQAA